MAMVLNKKDQKVLVLQQKGLLSTWAIPELRNDRKCKYIFMFLEINWTRIDSLWPSDATYGDIDLGQHWLR